MTRSTDASVHYLLVNHTNIYCIIQKIYSSSHFIIIIVIKMDSRYPRNSRPVIQTEYISVTNNGFVNLEDKDLCYIDDESSRTLELLQNNIDQSNKRHSLYGYLNTYTSTTTGQRLLKEAITRPLFNSQTIEDRLDCVEYLVHRVDTLSNIANNIKRFGQNIDLDNMIPCLINLVKTRIQSFTMAEKRLDAITTIETVISQIPSLVSALELIDQPLINVFKVALSDPAYTDINDDIHNVIEPEVKAGRGKRAKMFRIKYGADSLLDIARSTYNAAKSDLEQYVREINKDDGFSWKLNYGDSRGYYLYINTNQLPNNFKLPARYIRVNKSRAQITCVTQELMQLNVRASVSYENSMKLASEILGQVLTSIMQYSPALQKLRDIVGLLDLLTSFAKLVISSNGALVRPKFTVNETIVVKSRHPVLESVLRVNDIPVVPNDITLRAGDKNFMLITGPNMGGKSIFLKQVALIQVMAQLGCFVPAESALVKLVNRVVARSGTSDDYNSNCSSFMWEMRGIATALQEDNSKLSRSVLYVIDEVGRGTSIDDGSSYSFAIAEELSSRRNCFTVFATHFEQVFALSHLYGNITPYYFKYEDDEDSPESRTRLRISHKLVPGILDRDHYGIRIAEACGLSEEILAVAKKDLFD